jgi:hypothetical protein
MAGDWIKMRSDLHTHPKVIQILRLSNRSLEDVIFGLYRVASWFRVHSKHGVVHESARVAINSVSGIENFSQHLESCGWLLKSEDRLFLASNSWCQHEFQRKGISGKIRKSLLAEASCVKCGGSQDRLEIDHVIPIKRGGDSSESNLQVLCMKCNRRKSSK